MNYNLNELLKSLETSAGIEKQASTAEAVKPNVSAELSSILEKTASEDLTKKAHEEGVALAQQLMSKLANEINTANTVMQSEQAAAQTPVGDGSVNDVLNETLEKAIASGAESENKADELLDNGGHVNAEGGVDVPNEAQEKQAEFNLKDIDMSKLAELILEKIAAAETEVSTQPAANNLQADNQALDAQAAAKVQPTPGVDQPATVNQIFEAIVAKAKAEGAGSDNLVGDAGNTAAEGSGASETGVPLTEDQEKAAAVSTLVESGIDFDTAINLVKEAEQALAAESLEQEKQAAFGALVEAGIDFDTAVALVKEAEEEVLKKAKAA